MSGHLYCEDCGALVASLDGKHVWPESRMFCIADVRNGSGEQIRLACPKTLDHVGAAWDPDDESEVLYVRNVYREGELQA